MADDPVQAKGEKGARKDVKVNIRGAATLALAGHAAVVSITKALESAGVDATATEKAIGKLSARMQRALEDKAITPTEVNIPKPDGYDDQRHADLCASFAAGYREARESRRKTIATVTSVVTAVVALLGLLWKVYGGGLD